MTVGVGSKPDCGEMRLCNAWAGVRQGVGNRPGVTVEPKGGICPRGPRHSRRRPLGG
ncbi:MAG: hypothetical protein OXP66_17875 [Candidatus Tectomicrobia bacterium]|nr:hypothetical protein [Candidatus Tectomicrobia bacterium]